MGNSPGKVSRMDEQNVENIAGVCVCFFSFFHVYYYEAILHAQFSIGIQHYVVLGATRGS